MLRRFLHDHEEFRGEVIFTFDGDAAGQKAALRAFDGDQNFVSQTYVAVEPDGLDPCDLRIQKGDAAVRELVARRVPLYRFVLANVVGKYDLDRADGRVDAVREAARLVSSIRDKSKVDAFSRELAGMVGVDIEQARAEVRRAANRPATPSRAAPRAGRRPRAAGAPPPRQQLPDLRDPRFSLERETLKLVIQHPSPVGRSTTDVGANDFTHPTYRAVWELVAAAGGPSAGAGDAGWADRLRDAATRPGRLLGDQRARRRAAAHSEGARRRPTSRCTSTACSSSPPCRRIARPQVAAPAHQPGRARPTEYNRMFGELAALEAAPAQAARPGGRRLVRRRTKPSGRRRARGRRCWPGPSRPTGEVVAGTRDALYRRPATGASRGSRSRPPTGTATPRRSGSARSAAWGEQRVEHDLHDRGARPAAGAGPRAGHRQRRPAAARPASTGRRGLRVIARRAPRGDRPLAWFYEYDEGVDPDDPEVRQVATAALAHARDEVGLG